MSDVIQDKDSTIERIYKVVNQLSQHHTERVQAGHTLISVDREPLLSQIRQAMYGDLGKTEGGRSAAAQERSVLDITAFTLYEDISGRIESFHNHLTRKPKRATPEETLRAWYVAFDSNYRAGKYSDAQMRKVLQQLMRFAGRIRGHFDQPRIKELAGACPVETCGLAFTKSENGSAQSALYATYKNGEQPVVKCRGCGAEWVGERTLLELGYYLGATVDEDTLREMGVIV